MRIIQVKTENFMALVGEQTVPLSDLGLVHISGINHDDPGCNSNGAGKTTILEAITWCLFGEGLPRPSGNSEQGARADEVLNDQLKKQCRVVVQLADDDAVYTVYRWRKWKNGQKNRASNGAVLEIDGVPLETLDIDEVNRLIVTRIGITYDIWCRGVIFGQESSFNFCETTSLKRNEILTTILGIGEIDSWIKKCRDERSRYKVEAAEISGKLDVTRNVLDRLEQSDPSLKVAEWDTTQQRRQQEAYELLQRVEQEGLSLKQQLDQFGQFSELPPVNVEDNELVFKQLVDQKQNEHLAVYGELAQQKKTLALLEKEIDSIKRLQVGAVCPTCYQAITGEHQANCLAQAQFKQTAASAWVLKSQAVLDQVEKDLSSARYQLDGARRAKLAYMDALKKWEQRKLIFDHEKSQLEQKMTTTRTEWARYVEVIDKLKHEVNPYYKLAKDHVAQKEQALAELNGYEEKAAYLENQLNLCNWWDREFPRFKTWIFDSIVDTLTAEANKWLRVMSGGVLWVQISTQVQRNKKTVDELAVKIFRWNPDGSITSRPYRLWCGGEKRRVALAVDFGLSRLLSGRAAKPYHFLAIDEIDKHLDDKGREGLRTVLDALKDEKESVLIITHDPEFRASFDHEFVVEKKNSCSTIRGWIDEKNQTTTVEKTAMV